ncbi:MAG: hypothetical protein DRI65_15260 [Chloroflexota bacterium]|nr:MAG: hypothetical protein DRI65_15260 [Chloroflexota bacterium]
MNTPLIWILLPMLAAGTSLFFLRYRYILRWSGLGFGLILVVSGLVLPINEVFKFLFWEVKLSEQLLIFGRRFILSGADRPIVILLFSLWLFWLLIMDPKLVPAQFIPLSLAGICLILTAYSVEPIFYGALFFAFLALIYVVLLSPPGKEPTPGVLRFLIFQILGMLFILFAAWLASWIDLNSGNQVMLARSLLILALGFSFLLSIFPFISWISMVSERNHPFLSGYIFNTYFLGVFLFGTRFILEGGWIGQGLNIQLPFQLAGVIMLSYGGLMAIFSKHLGRLMGAVIIAEIGRSLLAISLFQAGFPIYFGMVILQSISLGVWSISLTQLQQGIQDLDFQSADGAARLWPVITSGLLLGYFALAGVPLLGGFPIYWALGSGLSYYPLWINSIFVLSTLGLVYGGLRLLGVLTKNAGEESILILAAPFYRYLILGLNVLLVLIGFLPQLIFRLTRTISDLLLGS